MTSTVHHRVSEAPRSVAGSRRGIGALPAWPLHLMVAGYPIWWALGASPFSSLAFASIMAVYLFLGGRAKVVPGLVPWFALLLWVAAASVTLQSVLQAVGFLQRFGDLIAVGIAMLYYVNARSRITGRAVVRSLTLLWVSVVVLGLLAIQFPDVRLTTPVGLILPQSLTSNELVYDMVFPPLAEVQTPWGAPEPFNRPAAPFPYANSWGAAYAILTPVVFAYLTMRPRRSVKWALIALLALSILPAIESSNRGMLLALGISIAYVIGRLALRGQILPAFGAVAAVLAAGLVLLVSGAADAFFARQEFSESNDARTNVYAQTFGATLESPFVGWATPQEDVTIGISLGTQGQAWLLMFSYGFVGLGIFLFFLWGAVLRTVSYAGMTQLWLHAVLVTIVPVMWFYSLGAMQMLSVALVAIVLLRARSYGEVVQ